MQSGHLSLHLCLVISLGAHSLSMLLQAMLIYWSGQETVVVAVPSLGRPLAQLQSAVGYFINMLPITSSVEPGMSGAEMVRAVRDSMRKAQANADVPFLEMMRVVSPARDASTTPIFQTMLVPSETNAAAEAGFGPSQKVLPIRMVSCSLRCSSMDFYRLAVNQNPALPWLIIAVKGSSGVSRKDFADW